MGALRRFSRLLFVLNPAACWLWVRGGKQLALTYLHHLWTLYLWPGLLPAYDAAGGIPAVPVQAAFPGLEVTRVELLHPQSRPGGVQIQELVILNALVRHLQPKRIVEIGTAEGRTTANLALSAAPDAEIITFDLPPEAASAPAENGPDYRQLGFERPGALLDTLPSNNVRRVLADSTRFDWTPYEGSVDLVFIDGGHDLGTVRTDTENALRIIRPNGVILWHDYNVFQYRDLTRWLDELGRQHPVVWLTGTSLACLRIGEKEAGRGPASPTQLSDRRRR